MRQHMLGLLGITCCMMVVAGGALAQSPDISKCTVSDGTINTCPYVHTGTSASERYVDLLVTLLDDNYDPVGFYDDSNFVFYVIPHVDYPDLGGGTNGDCEDCEDHYDVYCLDEESNIDGEMRIRVDLGEDCAPSMCCPVEVVVSLPPGSITDAGEVLMNTFDLVPNGDVRGSDFSTFSTAYNAYRDYGTLTPSADYIYSESDDWGEVTGPDFSAFSSCYKDCCGSESEPDPENCDPFTDPCP